MQKSTIVIDLACGTARLRGEHLLVSGIPWNHDARPAEEDRISAYPIDARAQAEALHAGACFSSDSAEPLIIIA